MKKITALFLSLLMVLSFTACGNEAPPQDTDEPGVSYG